MTGHQPTQPQARRAWLVGASQGMGRELAVLLARRGWQLDVSARDPQALSELAAATGARALALDATDLQAMRRTAQQVFAERPPQLVLMNVGDYRPMPADAFDPDLFLALNRTNYLASVNLLAAVLPLMRPLGGQILLNVSAAAYRGLPQAAPYSAPKAATLHMAEALRPELLRRGIDLRVINPGFVRSRLTAQNPFPMPFLLNPQQAARRIADGIESRRFEIAFPRRLIWGLKLLRCLPYRLYFAIMDRWILRT